MQHWQSFHYKNITYLGLSILLAIVLFKYEAFHAFLLNLGNLGYAGAFIAGIMFVSTFTVATGAVILLVLAEKLSPIEIGIIAGMGAVFGDYVIFRFIKSGLLDEITPLYSKLGGNHITKILHTKYFS